MITMANELKKIKQKLENAQYLELSSIRTGKTTAMIKATKENNGILICNDLTHAKQLSDKNQIRTMSILKKPNGINIPVFFDNYTIQILINESLQTIENLEEYNKRLENFIKNKFGLGYLKDLQ